VLDDVDAEQVRRGGGILSRIRSVHPAIFTDEAFASLPAEARVLLLALGTMSDYHDKFVWNERSIAITAGISDAGALLFALQEANLVRRDGKYGIINFNYGFRRRRLSRWDRLRAFIFSRDGNVCQYCGSSEPPLHCDHVVPVVLGGSDDPSNLTTACKLCNLSKGGRPLSKWMVRR
jgi:hypothetical protein